MRLEPIAQALEDVIEDAEREAREAEAAHIAESEAIDLLRLLLVSPVHDPTPPRTRLVELLRSRPLAVAEAMQVVAAIISDAADDDEAEKAPSPEGA